MSHWCGIQKWKLYVSSASSRFGTWSEESKGPRFLSCQTWKGNGAITQSKGTQNDSTLLKIESSQPWALTWYQWNSTAIGTNKVPKNAGITWNAEKYPPPCRASMTHRNPPTQIQAVATLPHNRSIGKKLINQSHWMSSAWFPFNSQGCPKSASAWIVFSRCCDWTDWRIKSPLHWRRIKIHKHHPNLHRALL